MMFILGLITGELLGIIIMSCIIASKEEEK